MRHQSQTLRDCDLRVKCLTCKDTNDVTGVNVHMEPVFDPDTTEFIQYDVEFRHAGDDADTLDHVYLQDLLCVEHRCSVFGKTHSPPDDCMFAFPFLTKSRRGDTWHSKPDSKDIHFAMVKR